MIRNVKKPHTPHPLVGTCSGVVSLAAFVHLQFIPDSKITTGARRSWFLEVLCSQWPAQHHLLPEWGGISWLLLSLHFRVTESSQETRLLAALWSICTAWMTESLCGLPFAACRRWPTPTYQSSAGTSCNTDVIIFMKIPMLVPLFCSATWCSLYQFKSLHLKGAIMKISYASSQGLFLSMPFWMKHSPTMNISMA